MLFTSSANALPPVSVPLPDSIAESFYFHAQHRNYRAIQRMLDNGYSINITDKQGNTPLCIALINNDTETYNILRHYGAATQHQCVSVHVPYATQPRSVVYKQQSTASSGFSLSTPSVLGTLAVVGGVGLAAAAIGGGGGGGGGGSGAYLLAASANNNSSNNNNNPSSGSNIPSSYFKTSEYTKGNFLSQIKAADAYARLYNLDDNGDLTSNLENVKVGIIDSGVYSANSEFSNKNVSGFNLDYGPCLNGDTSHCWMYDSQNQVLYFSDDNSLTQAMTTGEYNTWVSRYSDDYDWDNNQDNYFPLEGDASRHGTHVAGIIAADRNGEGMHGVAFSNAKLIAGRWDLIVPPGEAISKMVDYGAEVINMSFGTSATVAPASLMTDDLYNYNKDYFDKMILSGVQKAADNDVVMVMAAGNEGENQPGLWNGIPNLTAYKDSLENLFITVVATNSSGQLASYSNKCGVAKKYCLAAPGGDVSDLIYSTGTYDTDYYLSGGTSMATPVVSGSVALLLGAYPYMTPQQVVSLLFESANKKGKYSNSDTYGNGLLDLENATNPQGYLATISGNNVNYGLMNINASKINVPSVFQESILNHMPKTMVAFDKYKRPFKVNIAPMIQTTHSGKKKFKSDLYNFSRHLPKKEVNTENFAFSYAPSAYKNDDSGMGIAEVSYKTENRETSFAFSENTVYSGHTYNDSVLYNPYLAMNDAYGLSHQISRNKFNIRMSFLAGQNGLYDGDREYHDYNFDNQAYAFDTSVSYQMSPEVKLTAMTGTLNEEDALLGMNGRGALAIDDSNTLYAGVMLEWQPSPEWSFSGTYYNGWTRPSKKSNNIIRTSNLLSNSFALDGHYNINKTDVIGLQISSPLRIYAGYAFFDLATGRDNLSDTVYRQIISSPLKPSSREYKFALYHNQQIKKSILFKSELAMRLHPDHQKDAETDYRAMFSFAWEF